MSVPRSLRTWFIIHFAIDILFGLPLLFAPAIVMGLFGFSPIQPITTRLVGATLIGIGGVSYLVRDERKEVFSALLNMKIMWSLAAIVAIGLTILEGAPWGAWLFLGLFALFFGVWVYYKSTVFTKK